MTMVQLVRAIQHQDMIPPIKVGKVKIFFFTVKNSRLNYGKLIPVGIIIDIRWIRIGFQTYCKIFYSIVLPTDYFSQILK